MREEGKPFPQESVYGDTSLPTRGWPQQEWRANQSSQQQADAASTAKSSPMLFSSSVGGPRRGHLSPCKTTKGSSPPSKVEK